MGTPATRENTELLEGQNRVLELIAQGAPLPGILGSLLGVIQAQSPGMFCSILLLDSDGIHLRHGAARGLPEAYIRSIDGEPIGPRAGSCGTAAFRREPVVVEDIATDPLWDDYRELAIQYGLRAAWSTPIFDAERRVLGTFAMYFGGLGGPDARHLRLIDISTHIAAIAITRHQRVEALRASEERLAGELKERTRAEKEIQALTARLITAQEEERTRIARELHDDLGQQIATLSIAASNLKKNIAPEAAEARAQSERIQQKLVQLAEGIRRLSDNLHPAVLEHSGLGAALRTYASEFSTLTGITISFRAEGSFERLPVSVALCLYRIAQEALQNVLKHARVDRAELAITGSAESVSLSVSDQGAGMDTLRASIPQGLGLVNIRERTRLVNGTLSIASQPNQGTILNVMVPISDGAY